MLCLAEIDVPVRGGRGIILPVIVVDGDLVEIQPLQIFQIIVVQRPVPAVRIDIARKQLPVDMSACAAGRGIGERTRQLPDDRVDAGGGSVDHGG